jgi:hypothetical protein
MFSALMPGGHLAYKALYSLFLLLLHLKQPFCVTCCYVGNLFHAEPIISPPPPPNLSLGLAVLIYGVA